MSMMQCTKCGDPVDTDIDPEGFYVVDGEYWCKPCRDKAGWPPDDEVLGNKEDWEMILDHKREGEFGWCT